MRTGYLSITRGDGGQNLIGSEQGPALGLIRTQELLAARRIDGAEQFFTRARDFGFSKSPEETLRIWGKDAVLADVVAVIRRFRPDVIVTRFSPEPSDTHGHHTASAMLALEAFRAAADPQFHPEQLAGGVTPWQARRIFWNRSSWAIKPSDDLAGDIKLDVGGYNPLLGASYGEIAADSRSMHKSQGFGVARSRAPIVEYFRIARAAPTGAAAGEAPRRSSTASTSRGAGSRAARRSTPRLARAVAGFDAAAPRGVDPGAGRDRRRARRRARCRLAGAEAARGQRAGARLRGGVRRGDRAGLPRRRRRRRRGHGDARRALARGREAGGAALAVR